MGTVLFAGTRDGVVTVADQDGGWTIEGHALKGWEVHDVETVPGKPGRVYAGVRGDGVWRSDDYGQKWSKPSYGKVAPGKVRCVTADVDDPDTLYAGTEPIGLWKSTDAGESWAEIESVRNFPHVATVTYPAFGVEPHLRDVTFDPSDPKTIYAALQVGSMLKSTDGGESWQLLEEGLGPDVHTIVTDPVNANRVYVATGRHLYRSEDGGASWAQMALGLEQSYAVPMVMDPADPSVLYSALANGTARGWAGREGGAESVLIRTKDAGATWETLPGDPDMSRGFPEGIVIDPEEPGRMYAGTRAGGELFTTGDGGETWVKLDVTVPAVAKMNIAHR